MSGDSDDEQEFIAEHLAQARVFRRYGLSDKAWDQYVIILGRFPDHTEAREEILTLEFRTRAQTEAIIADIVRRTPRGN